MLFFSPCFVIFFFRTTVKWTLRFRKPKKIIIKKHSKTLKKTFVDTFLWMLHLRFLCSSFKLKPPILFYLWFFFFFFLFYFCRFFSIQKFSVSHSLFSSRFLWVWLFKSTKPLLLLIFLVLCISRFFPHPCSLRYFVLFHLENHHSFSHFTTSVLISFSLSLSLLIIFSFSSFLCFPFCFSGILVPFSHFLSFNATKCVAHLIELSMRHSWSQQLLPQFHFHYQVIVIAYFPTISKLTDHKPFSKPVINIKTFSLLLASFSLFLSFHFKLSIVKLSS